MDEDGEVISDVLNSATIVFHMMDGQGHRVEFILTPPWTSDDGTTIHKLIMDILTDKDEGYPHYRRQYRASFYRECSSRFPFLEPS